MAQQFQVDLRAVVELLARHVYSSPRVYVRELLQNGVDAVTARRLADPGAPHGPIRFRPSDAGGDGALLVEDPGIGLTVDEVHELLATIGGSSKRDELDLPREGFLGRFGIGLLSCFVVADRIEVVTRSATGTDPVRFVGHDDGTYDVEPLAVDDPAVPEVGTVVRLAPRPGHEHWTRADLIERLAREFGGALPVPVVVERPDGTWSETVDPEPPWLGAVERADVPGREAAQVAWCERQFGFRPLDVIPIGSAAFGAEGVAFVLPFEGNASANPGHRTYLRRMLLSEQERTVLPEWAFFVRAVVDVGTLQPTASRESLVDDADLAAAAEELGASVRAWLLRLGAVGGEVLHQFLAIHGRAAKALASHDETVLDALFPFLRFETTDGLLSVDEIVERAKVVRFATTVDRFRQLAPIAAAQGLVIVNAGYSYDQDVLLRIPLVRDGIEVVPIEDDEIVSTLDAVPVDREVWAARFLELARAALDEVGCDVELRDFAPDVVPALFLHDEDARDRRRLRSTADDVDDAWAGLLAELDDGGSDRPRLVCNDRHPLVRRLVDAAMADAPPVGTVVQALYVQALLLGHHPLRVADLTLLNRALLDLVDGVLDP